LFTGKSGGAAWPGGPQAAPGTPFPRGPRSCRRGTASVLTRRATRLTSWPWR